MANASPIGRMIASGFVTATGATTANVAFAQFNANKHIVLFSLRTVGGTIAAHPYLFTATTGTGFGLRAGASDTSVYNWAVFQIEGA